MNDDVLDARWRILAARLHKKVGIPKTLIAFVDRIVGNIEDGLSHTQCLALLPTYVTLELNAEDVEYIYPEVAYHLARCESCEIAYADLMQLEMAIGPQERDISLREAAANIVTITKVVVARISPSELDDNDSLMREYFADYAINLSPRTGGVEYSEVMGFDSQGVFFLPITLAIAASVDFILRVESARLNPKEFQILVSRLTRYSDEEVLPEIKVLFPPEHLQWLRDQVLGVLERFGVIPRRAEQIVKELLQPISLI